MYLHKQAHFTVVITHFYRFSIIKKRKPKTEGVGKRKMWKIFQKYLHAEREKGDIPVKSKGWRGENGRYKFHYLMAITVTIFWRLECKYYIPSPHQPSSNLEEVLLCDLKDENTNFISKTNQ